VTARNVPINKGNYSMDTAERESLFQTQLAEGWEDEYRSYRANWVEYAKSQTLSEFPLLVDLELSSVCNLRCPMCYTISPEFRQHVNARLMDFALFTRVIDEIAGKVPALRLSLRGEATLHPGFVACIEYAKRRGIGEVSTLTHGGKLTGDFLARVIEAGIDWITISVDGVGETYDRIRKPLRFAQILEHLKEIKSYKKQRGLRRPVIKVQGIWPAISDNPKLYYDSLAPYVDLVAFNPLIDYLANDTHIEYLEDFTCPQQYQRLVIGADGLVMKCSNDEENREIIGDINKQTVHEVWHGEAMTRVREMHKRPRGFMESPVCRKCYLPRKTEDEEADIGERTFIVRNYTKRIQIIGR